MQFTEHSLKALSIKCLSGRILSMNEVPLFPLPLVLFPGGKLPLQVFEARYLDMVKRCLREQSGFGIVMITAGDQHPGWPG